MIGVARSRATPIVSSVVEIAFLAAFDEYTDGLYRHASYRLSDPDRATDITQDAFIKAWDYLCDGGTVTNWKAFLYRILNNLIIDEYRRTKGDSLDALLDQDETGTKSAALLTTDSRQEKEERLDTQMAIDTMRRFIAELPEPYRVALTLRYLDGLTPKEIAQTLNISENVASVRIHRAVARLRECYHSL